METGDRFFFALQSVNNKNILLTVYSIGDRGTRSFKKLTELFAGNDMVGFVAKERVDGKLVLPEAVQILKIGTTGKVTKP